MSLFKEKKATGNWFIDHSLSLVVGGILLFQILVTALWFSPRVWIAEGQQGEYWDWYWHEFQMSTLADTYGVLLIVILSKFLFERGSNESKDAPSERQENG